MNPPKAPLNLIEKHFAKFLWDSTGDKNKFHWNSWKNLCIPEEGDIEIRRMWRFRTCPFLWADYLKAKYCSRSHPATAAFGGTIGQVKDHLLKWNEEWNTHKLEQLLPTHIVHHISIISRGKQNNNDQAIWKLMENGYYSNASACEAARHLWEFFENPLEIRHQATSISSALNQWWQRKPKNLVHKMILHIIPITISCELWKSYTSCKFGEGKKVVLYKMKSQIIWNINAAINKKYPSINTHSHWYKNCEMIEDLKPIPIWKSVLWEVPPSGFLKLNTDGSLNKQNGKAGIGGILRDEEGGFVMAFSMPIICNSVSEAKLKAIKYGCEWCKNKGILNFIVESDLRMIGDMLQTKTLSNNKLKQEAEKLLYTLDICRAPINHCLREAIQVADWFAKEATKANEGIIHTDFRQIPKAAKGPFFMDMWQVPSFRIRYEKSNFLVS
ncbi:uncharacterized protein LOC107778956 [Nicotiana tabacum]|uniref:Uncharacterized protein LOC107778956 n=1 Tax=Nicotiana tabacum TaxID=4097 RepID=A0AC58S526_TOBAC